MLGSQNFAEEQHRARQLHGKAREPLAQRTPIILSYHPQPPPLSLWPPSVTTLAFTRSPFLVSTVPRTRPSLAFNRRDMPSGAALNHQLPQSKHQPSITFTSAGPSTLISQAPGAATSSAIPDSVAVRGGRRRIGKRQNNLHFSSCCFVVVVVGGGGGGGSSPVLHEGSSCDLSDMLRLANEPDRPPPAWPDPGFCPSPRASNPPKKMAAGVPNDKDKALSCLSRLSFPLRHRQSWPCSALTPWPALSLALRCRSLPEPAALLWSMDPARMDYDVASSTRPGGTRCFVHRRPL